MTITDNGGTSRNGGVKTLAIRLESDLHAQLSLIAQLRGSTITDEIKKALEAHIAAASDAPELAARAGSALEEIERDASARRDAIATLFGSTPKEVTDNTTARPRRSSGSSANSAT